MNAFAPLSASLDARTEHQICSDQVAWYTRVRDGHLAYVESANKNDAFYQGKQWDEADLNRLRAERRPALTINMILSTINTLVGEHAKTAADVAFEPIRGGSEATAACLSKLWEDITNRNRFRYEEREVFEDGLIMRRGWFDIRMDVGITAMGDVKIRAIDPREMIIDPDGQKYDPTTWGFIGRTWWASLNDIALDYGLNDEQISALRAMGGADNESSSGMDHIMFRTSTFGGVENTMWGGNSGEEAALEGRKLYRVLEREYYVRAQIQFLVDPRTGDSRQVPDHWDAAFVSEFASQHQLRVDTRIGRRVRWTVTCGSTVLRDMWSPYRTFTKRPYFPYFRRGNPMGVVDNLISPQEQLNKIASQELHVINTTANSGWKIPKGSLTNMTIDELKSHGAETGVVIEFNQAKGEPEKIQPNQIPAALDRAEQKAQMNIAMISGLPPGMVSKDPQQTPNGQTVEFVKDRTNTQNQVVMENLARTREMVIEKVLELVQDFMTHERVIFATVDGDEPQEVVMNQITAAGEIVNDVTKGEYKAVVTMIPARDTYRENQMMEAMALMSQGVMIRPERLVKLSSLADRDLVAAEVAADSGRGPVTPEEQQQMQAQKMAEMQSMMLQLEELKASVMQLQSQAMLNQAKAGAAVAMTEVAMADVEASVQNNRETNALRESLAQLNAASKMDGKVIDAQVRVALQKSKNQGDLVNTVVSQQAKPNESEMTAPPAAGPSSEE